MFNVYKLTFIQKLTSIRKLTFISCTSIGFNRRKRNVFALKRVSKLNSGQRLILTADSTRLVMLGFARISESTRRRNTDLVLEVLDGATIEDKL